jgi:hypothetical protein
VLLIGRYKGEQLLSGVSSNSVRTGPDGKGEKTSPFAQPTSDLDRGFLSRRESASDATAGHGQPRRRASTDRQQLLNNHRPTAPPFDSTKAGRTWLFTALYSGGDERGVPQAGPILTALSAIFLHWMECFFAGFRAFSKSGRGLAASGNSHYCPTDRVCPRLSGVGV